MERYAWKAILLPGMKAEYIRRHDKIREEMKDIMTMQLDPETHAQPRLAQVFYFN